MITRIGTRLTLASLSTLTISAVAVGCGGFGGGGGRSMGNLSSSQASGSTASGSTASGASGPTWADVFQLLDSTLSCKSCHSPGGIGTTQKTPSGGTSRMVLSGTSATDYTTITTSGLIDTKNPSMSPLLENAIGQLTHGGGPQIQSTDQSYQTILAWITAGASQTAAAPGTGSTTPTPAASPTPVTTPTPAPSSSGSSSPTWNADIFNLLEKTLSCGACHMSGGIGTTTKTPSGTASRMILTGNAQTDFTQITTSGLIDTSNAASSVLLQDACGGMSHVGGSLLQASASDPHYTMLLDWIQGGAPQGSSSSPSPSPSTSPAPKPSTTPTPSPAPTSVAGKPTWIADVFPLFQNTLSCKACHQPGMIGVTTKTPSGAASRMILTLVSATDYKQITTSGLIDTSSPANAVNSVLLQNATGGLSHGGGAILTTSSAAYTTLLDWIQTGAPMGSGTPAPTPSPTPSGAPTYANVIAADLASCTVCHAKSASSSVRQDPYLDGYTNAKSHASSLAPEIYNASQMTLGRMGQKSGFTIAQAQQVVNDLNAWISANYPQ